MTRARISRLSTFHESAPSLRVLRWIVLPALVVHVVLASISGYRAIVQVYHVDIAIGGPMLRPGTNLAMSVASSGRTTIDAQLVLIQQTHAETLAVLRIPGHENASYDPRTIHAAKRLTLTSEQLGGFQPGPAVLRAIGNGRSQWLRVPPPVITERQVPIDVPVTALSARPSRQPATRE
jgi:hypothetical protein